MKRILVFAGKIASDQAASPQMILGIPGINPLIPIWYGILGLLIAVVVHEFAHGILTRVNGMKINALGVLAFVVPIGAFVEPDEEQLTTTTKKNRTDVYSVGPGTNMFIAIICALILFMLLSSALAPIREGPVVTSIYSGSPADMAGVQTGAQIVAINGVPVSSNGYTNFTGAENIAPGQNVSVQYYYYNTQYTASVTSGVVINRHLDQPSSIFIWNASWYDHLFDQRNGRVLTAGPNECAEHNAFWHSICLLSFII